MVQYAFTDAVCIECGWVIRNFLCQHCLAHEIRIWLFERNMPKKRELLEYIRRLADGENREIGAKCIICGSDVFVCRDCFLDDIYNEIKNLGAGKDFIEEFMETFRLGFNHSIHSEEHYSDYEQDLWK